MHARQQEKDDHLKHSGLFSSFCFLCVEFHRSSFVSANYGSSDHLSTTCFRLAQCSQAYQHIQETGNNRDQYGSTVYSPIHSRSCVWLIPTKAIEWLHRFVLSYRGCLIHYGQLIDGKSSGYFMTCVTWLEMKTIYSCNVREVVVSYWLGRSFVGLFDM